MLGDSSLLLFRDHSLIILTLTEQPNRRDREDAAGLKEELLDLLYTTNVNHSEKLH